MRSILVVDGDEAVARSMSRDLRTHSYDPYETTTGQDGLVHAACRQFDAVILGLDLPDIGGVEIVASATRDDRPDHCHLSGPRRARQDPPARCRRR